jgi:hypothetical protein
MKELNDKLPLEEITVDSSEQVPTPKGFRYSLDITCVGTTYGWTYPMKRKSDSEQLLKSFIEQADRSIHDTKVIRFLTSDHGGEFTSSAFENFLKERGIIHQTGPPDTPNLNPQERHNRTLNQKQRALLMDAKLGPSFWIFARDVAQQLKNLTPTQKLKHAITPFEAFYNRQPDLRMVRSFGCICYAHISKHQRTKHEPTSVRGIFVGYDVARRGYKILINNNSKLIISRSVTFNEELHVQQAMGTQIPQEVKLIDGEKRKSR